MLKEKIIIDEDWGSDAMEVAAVLLAHPQVFTVLGATAVFGNTDQAHVLKNAGDILNLLNVPQVPYFPGATGPTGSSLLEGDGAHGSDGIGGVFLKATTTPPEKRNAVDFILETLRNEPYSTVTIIAGAPQTNIAQAIEKDRDTMMRVKRIIIMGGCTQKMPAADMPFRQGNRTPDSEFNFFMAAQDAHTVLKSGLPIVLFPMNCTHQLTLTADREDILREGLAQNSAAAEAVISMIKAPQQLDRMKFNSAPVMHDVHTALWLLHPENYTGRRGLVDVTVGGKANGRTDFYPSHGGNVTVMETVIDPDKLFACVVKSFQECLLSPAPPQFNAAPEQQVLKPK